MTGNKAILFAIGGILSVALIAFLGIRSVAAEAVYPVERAGLYLVRGVKTRLRGIVNANGTAVENAGLKRQIAALEMVRAENEFLRSENERLRNAAGQRSGKFRNWLQASVLSNGGTIGLQSIIRISKGSLDGVHENAPVAVPEGLVGRVLHVSPHTAEIILITDPSVKVSCEIVTGDPSLGTIRGILSGGGIYPVVEDATAGVLFVIDPLRLKLTGGELNIPPRTKVVTSGLGGIFPKGLEIGYIVEVCENRDNHLIHEGAVIPSVDFSDIEEVFVFR